MRGLWHTMMTGGCAATAMLAQTSASAAPVPTNAHDAYATFTALMQAHKCPELLALYATPLVADMLATLPVEMKLAVDAGGLECARQSKQFDLALKFAIAGTELNDPRPQFWFMRMDMEWAAGKHADMVSSLETLATANPDALTKVNLQWFDWVGPMLLAAKETDLQKRINAVLGAPGFHPAEPGASTDGYRYAAAVSAMTAGRTDAAKAIFAQITAPTYLLRVTLDPRLRLLAPASFDARAAVERHMDAAREVAAAHPDNLGATLALVQDYALVDKAPEMLALLLPMQPGKTHPALIAQPDQVRGWWSSVALAYHMEGDYDKAIATLRQSMAPGEINDQNQMELTDVAAMQLQFGRATDALASLAPLDKVSSGFDLSAQAIARKLHGCATWLGGKPAIAEADLAYLNQHDADAPGNSRALALCMHRDAEAAASFINDLADPDKTVGILVLFSTFTPAPKTYPHDWYRDGIGRVKMRPDVSAAIAKAGGTGNFDIPPL